MDRNSDKLRQKTASLAIFALAMIDIIASAIAVVALFSSVAKTAFRPMTIPVMFGEEHSATSVTLISSHPYHPLH